MMMSMFCLLLSFELLAISAKAHWYFYSFGPLPLLPLVSDTTGTISPIPLSSRAQACQPAAQNLPVCLELLETQAGPGEDKRQRKVEDKRGGGTGGWRTVLEKGKQTTETEKQTEIRHIWGDRGSQRVTAAQLREVAVYLWSLSPRARKELHQLRACSQKAPLLGYCLLTGWPRGPEGPAGPCSDIKGKKTESVRKCLIPLLSLHLFLHPASHDIQHIVWLTQCLHF